MIGTTTSRAFAWVIGVVVLTAAAVVVATRLQAPVQVVFGDDAPPQLFSGLYGAERAPDGLTYAWSRPNFGLTVPGLDRNHPWIVTVRYRAARPDESTPTVTIALDGVVVAREVLAHDFVERRLELPARAGSLPTQVAFTVDPPYVPAGDPRALGALVDWIRLEPADAGAWVWPTARAWVAVLPFVLLPVCWALIGVPPTRGLVLWGLTAAGAAMVVTHGVGPYSLGPSWLLAVVAVITGLVPWVFQRPLPGAALVCAVTSGVVAVKLLTVFHPGMPTGDAVFHAHRFQTVLEGNLLFTSITPGNYAFPYAPGLYVAAVPFADWAVTVPDKAGLLRLLTTCVEAGAVAWLLTLAWRWRRDATAGVIAVAAYHLLPLSFNVLAVGNLTNLFAQALALGALVVAAHAPLRASTAALLFVLGLAASLSHTSTFAVLTAQLALLVVLLLLTRRLTLLRVSAMHIAGVTAAVVIVAVGAYYAHFGDVYREAFGRAAVETGQATAVAGGRTPLMRLRDVPRLLELYYSWPALLLMIPGAREWWKDPAGPTVPGRLLGAWALACAGFILLGIITPVDMRHYLAAIPLVAVLAGTGLAALWQQEGVGRWAGAALAAWLAVTGVVRWFAVLG
jgi:hypothetical protein